MGQLRNNNNTNINNKRTNNNGSEDPRVVWDVLVIGAGATGCGIALDAASRGLTVACLDQGDIAGETSSRSTKLLWAGLRYLATAAAGLLNAPLSQWLSSPTTILGNFVDEFQMVRVCHRERRYMLETQRHLCHWMPIAVPFTSFFKVPTNNESQQPPPFGNSFFLFFPMLAPFVFFLYDALGAFANPRSYCTLANNNNNNNILEHLRRRDEHDRPYVRYMCVFGEGMHNDSRTCLAIAQTAIRHGAVVCNYMQAVDVIRTTEEQPPQQQHDSIDFTNKSSEAIHCTTMGKEDSPPPKGRIQGVWVRDQISGETFPVYAKQIVLAGGPFTDELRHTLEGMNASNSTDICNDSSDTSATASTPQRVIRESAGTHIVLRGGIVPPDMGILDYNTSDGRFLFVLPWLGHTLVGTTDDPSSRTQSRHDPPERDIDYLLKECQTYIKIDNLQRSDVLSAWRGWRPLAMDPNAPPGAPASRDHIISHDPETGVIFVAGGKWTTWREMAQEAVDRVLENLDNNYATTTNSSTAEYYSARVMTTRPPCRTLDIVLHGGGDESATTLMKGVIDRFPDLDLDIVEHLVSTYGSFVWDMIALFESMESNTSTMQRRLVPDYPYIEAEVVYGCQSEYACTVADVLCRRTRLAYLNKTAATAAIPRVAELMAKSLGWTERMQHQQVLAALEDLSSFGGPVPLDLDSGNEAKNVE